MYVPLESQCYIVTQTLIGGAKKTAGINLRLDTFRAGMAGLGWAGDHTLSGTKQERPHSLTHLLLLFSLLLLFHEGVGLLHGVGASQGEGLQLGLGNGLQRTSQTENIIRASGYLMNIRL